MSDRHGEGGQQSKVCGRRTLELLCWTGLFSWRVGDDRLAAGVFVPSRQTVWDCEALRDISWTLGWSVVTGRRRGEGTWGSEGVWSQGTSHPGKHRVSFFIVINILY